MLDGNQLYRLREEQIVINKYFPDFRFFDFNNEENCSLVGSFYTDSGKEYSIQIFIQGFPYMVPNAYILSPKPLYDYYGRPMTSYGASSQMHTLQPYKDYVHMCLYRAERWSANISLVKLILKARIWIEAYEWHLASGKNICDYTIEMY